MAPALSDGEPGGEILKTVFTVKGVLFFRPLSDLYLYIMYLVFGANPLPFHVAALALHFASACLVVAIVRVLVRDEVIAWVSGFVYALAVVLEPLLWAVGIFDVGASFFSLLAILLFIRERPVGCAVAYLVACLFKESAIVLPIILLGYAVIAGAPNGKQMLARVRKLVPVAVALVVMIVIKAMGVHPYSLPLSDPYVVRFSGPHVGTLFAKYVFALFQSFFPFGATKGPAFKILLVSLALFLVVTSWLVSKPRRNETAARAHWFVLLWLLVALLPTLFLRNRGYRYYVMPSLPAFIALTFLQLSALCAAVRLGTRYRRSLLAIVGALAVVLSLSRADKVLKEGLEPKTLTEGNNNLIRKAALVDIVHDNLMKNLPAPPHGAVIILGNVDVWAFNKDSGPRVWYGDGSISVYPIESLKVDSTGVYLQNPVHSQRQLHTGGGADKLLVDPAKVFGFVFEGRRLRPVKFTGMPKSTVKPAP